MPTDFTSRNALVLGATAGIGEGIAVQLASRGANVTIAGRNADAGASVIERMRAASPSEGASFEFLPLDASTLAGSHAFALVFADAHAGAPLHVLAMCQATASFGGRQETAEGLELKLVLHAYSRFLIARDLLPMLRLAKSDGGARVLSVLSGGVHRSFTDWDDADLLVSFSLRRAADAAGFYNDVALQHFADDEANASIGFLHAAPGFVASQWGHQTKAAFAIKLAQKLFAKSADTCAEILVGALADPRYATGFHPVSEHGRPAKTTPQHTAANVEAMQAHLQALYARTL